MTLSRRDFLRSAGGGIGAAAVGTGVVRAQPSFGGWMSSARNYDGIVDRTGQDAVTVKVGAGSSNLAFGPAAVRIDPGTKVEWEWTGEGGEHNVHAMEGASFQSDLYSESGVHFSHTFESSGIVKYQCDPHAAVGMKGVVVVGDVEVSDGGGDGGGGLALPTDALGSTLLATTFGLAGVAALLVLGEEYGPAAIRRARGERRAEEVDLTEEQRDALQRGETIEVVTEDGNRVTIRPPE